MHPNSTLLFFPASSFIFFAAIYFFPGHITAPVSDYGYRNFIFTAPVNITVPVKHLVAWKKNCPGKKKSPRYLTYEKYNNMASRIVLFASSGFNSKL